MSRTPLISSSGSTPESQRLLAGVREIVLELLQRARIIRAPQGEATVRVPTGSTAAVAGWGTLTRFEPPYAGVAVMPRQRSDLIGVPFYVAKAVATGVLRLVSQPADGYQPRINGSPTGAYATGAGLYRFISDGRDWFY